MKRHMVYHGHLIIHPASGRTSRLGSDPCSAMPLARHSVPCSDKKLSCPGGTGQHARTHQQSEQRQPCQTLAVLQRTCVYGVRQALKPSWVKNSCSRYPQGGSTSIALLALSEPSLALSDASRRPSTHLQVQLDQPLEQPTLQHAAQAVQPVPAAWPIYTHKARTSVTTSSQTTNRYHYRWFEPSFSSCLSPSSGSSPSTFLSGYLPSAASLSLSRCREEQFCLPPVSQPSHRSCVWDSDNGTMC